MAYRDGRHDQSVVARRPPRRRAHDRSGAAAVDGRGGIRLVGCSGRRRPGTRRLRRHRPGAAGGCSTTASRSRSTAEDGGNPVIGLVAQLRERAAPAVAPWIHRGLTSQDVLDTSSDAGRARRRGSADQRSSANRFQRCRRLRRPPGHADGGAHPHPARGTHHLRAKAAGWLDGVVDACERVRSLVTPVQIGGAVGTHSAINELATLITGTPDPAEIAERVIQSAATALGLAPGRRGTPRGHRSPPSRTPLSGCTDGWGRIASDVVTLARPEIAELSEPATRSRGGSSSMPHKRNPVLSILIRRAAMSAPQLAATLHTAAALANDERPDGAGTPNGTPCGLLARRTVVAGSQCGELLAGLRSIPIAMAENLGAPTFSGNNAPSPIWPGRRRRRHTSERRPSDRRKPRSRATNAPAAVRLAAVLSRLRNCTSGLVLTSAGLYNALALLIADNEVVY